MYKYLFKSLLSVLWGTYPEVKSLDQMVILCLIFFEEPPYCSLEQLHHFTFPPAVHKFPISPALVILVVFSVRWYLIMVLTCIMTGDVGDLFVCLLLDICIPSLEKYLFRSFALF